MLTSIPGGRTEYCVQLSCQPELEKNLSLKSYTSSATGENLGSLASLPVDSVRR